MLTRIVLAFLALAAPLPAQTLISFSPKWCNCTDAPIVNTLCHVSRVSTGIEVGGSVGSDDIASVQAMQKSFVETGLSSCIDVVQNPHECHFFEYVFNCVQEDVGVFFSEWVCTLVTVALESEPAGGRDC